MRGRGYFVVLTLAAGLWGGSSARAEAVAIPAFWNTESKEVHLQYVGHGKKHVKKVGRHAAQHSQPITRIA